MNVPSRVAALLVVVATGLALRLLPLGLPWSVTKYGGSVAWGAMVALLLPWRSPWLALAAVEAMELLRLVHWSWLDALRSDGISGFLLGRHFSIWNMLAYAVGVLAIYTATRRTP